MPELHLKAPAKINLGLEVLRRRTDGYHDISTVFVAVALFDDIVLATRDDDRIVCRVEGNPDLEAGEDNLCVRAARALRSVAMHELPGLDIALTKRIPMGAGLGGGSSDAAAVLLGAARLWGLQPGSLPLTDLAAGLGSDVPFFLHGGIALAGGRGELLHPVELALPWTVLLVNPGIHIPTPWAYKAIGRTGERGASDLVAHLRRGTSEPGSLMSSVVNDFEDGVFSEYPLLQELKERLYDAGAEFALMSGSGSTMFGLFQSHEAAVQAARRFQPYWTATAGFLPSAGSMTL